MLQLSADLSEPRPVHQLGQVMALSQQQLDQVTKTLLEFQQEMGCAGLVFIILHSKETAELVAVSDTEQIDNPISLALVALQKSNE